MKQKAARDSMKIRSSDSPAETFQQTVIYSPTGASGTETFADVRTIRIEEGEKSTEKALR